MDCPCSPDVDTPSPADAPPRVRCALTQAIWQDALRLHLHTGDETSGWELIPGYKSNKIGESAGAETTEALNLEHAP